MKISPFRVLLILCSLAFALPLARAQDLSAVKARIDQRLPHLDSLKSSGAIGENNQGFVEVRNASGDAASVVQAENADRHTVYAEIAAKNGTTAEAVGRARARHIAKNSGSGVWVQQPDGSWVRS